MNFTLLTKRSPLNIASSLSNYWSPQVIDEFDDYYIKVAKLKGCLTWHQHEKEDEVFFILKGSLQMALPDKTIGLSAGDSFVVPAGLEHNPVAHEECLVMLIEKKTTLHTGNVNHPKTKSIAAQLNP